jgi:hypothetical protein
VAEERGHSFCEPDLGEPSVASSISKVLERWASGRGEQLQLLEIGLVISPVSGEQAVCQQQGVSTHQEVAQDR